MNNQGDSTKMSNEKLKILFLTNIPTPYKRPRLNSIANLEQVELVVYYSSNSTSRHFFENMPDADFDWIAPDERSISSFINADSIVKLHSLKNMLSLDVDVYVVGGWNYLAAWTALVASKLRECPIGIISANTTQAPASEMVLSHLLTYFDFYFALSDSAQENFTRMGINQSRIETLPNAVDVAKFQDSISMPKQREIRQQWDLPDSGIVLYVGNIESVKGVDTLINASMLSTKINHLLIIGDGPQKENMKELSNNKDGVEITFTGRLPNPELPNYYALSDLFVLPTKGDTWGLVVNEAMACGTPVISTTEAGASGELLRHGENGLVIPPNDEASLAEAIDRLLTNDEERQKFAEKSLKYAERYTPEKYAEQLVEVVESVMSEY